jgi:DNA-binding NarL/FixJ family response regulator
MIALPCHADNNISITEIDPMSVSVAIVEDDEDARAALRILIDSSGALTCVADCGSGEEALHVLPALAPDVILMDIQLPGMSGIECIREFKRLNPKQQILMLTVFEDSERIFKSLEAGAVGYILKTTPRPRLLESILEVHSGGAPMSGQIARQVVESFRRPAPPELKRLSDRETEVLEQLSQGRLYKEIADSLGITVNTVRTHIRSIYEKLEARNRTEAVAKVLGQRAEE